MISRSFTDYIEVNPKIVLEKDKEYPFIEMSNVGIFQREPENIDVKKFGSGTKFEKGDTVVARIEPCLQNGKGFFIKDFEVGFGSTEFLVFRSKDESKLDKVYLYYLMQDKYIRENMIRSMTGATGRQRVNNKVFDNIKINIPNLDKQKKIAGILKLYDDLIENNLQRINLLEESAELIYKEWFVNFRFPGYEKCEFVDGIPQNWEKINLYDISEVKMGYAFKSNDFNEEELGTPAIRIRDIPNQTTKTYTTQKADEDYIVKRGDILIGMDGAFYNDVWGGEEGYLVQRVCRLRANDPKYHGYLWQAIKEPINYYEKTITGATVAHLGAKHLKEIYILKTSREFELNLEVFNNLYKKKVNLLQQNQKLKEARDILIPKLIMGEIEV